MKNGFNKLLLMFCILLAGIGSLFLSFNSVRAMEQKDYAMHVVEQKTGKNTAYDIDTDADGEITVEPEQPSLNKIQDLLGTTISTQNIIGTDDRQLINSISYPYTTIARITVTHQDGSLTYGSGAMIGSRLFATAGHVLINSRLSHPRSIKIEFGLYATSTYYTTSSYSEYIYYGDYQGYNPDHDYGFVVLSSNVGTEVTGHMGFVTECYDTETIYAAGYPGGNPYMYLCAGSVCSHTDDLLYIDADFTAGQSGGPIYILYDGVPYLKGVISGNAGTTNIGRRLNYPLYQWLSSNGYL